MRIALSEALQMLDWGSARGAVCIFAKMTRFESEAAPWHGTNSPKESARIISRFDNLSFEGRAVARLFQHTSAATFTRKVQVSDDKAHRI